MLTRAQRSAGYALQRAAAGTSSAFDVRTRAEANRAGWRGSLVLLLFVGLAGASLRCSAQDLEPRAYAPNPMGANFVALGFVNSSGEVLFDPAVPLTDVQADLDAWVIGYVRTFGLFDRSANVGLVLPYVLGDVAGNVGEDRRAITRSGFGDTRLRLAMNIFGGPALTPAEFARRTPQWTLGASLTIVAPTGEYMPDKLINIGSNRWAFKPELGVSFPLDRWYLEGYAGVWLFTDNDNFYGGSLREQDPVTTFQAHVAYTFRPRLWLAFDANYYRGGRTTVDGVPGGEIMANSRAGLTLSIPFGARQSCKVTWSEGVTTRLGGEFRTIGVAWQYVWFD
jgi:hypothetical protein